MFTLYFGGQKSGKSKLAEQKALELSVTKPYYLATYNNSYDDNEMQSKVNTHKKQRADNFTTIEEQFNLPKIIKDDETYLIDCISMWILNNLDKNEAELLEQLERLSHKKANIVFVLNDVNSGVIPIDKLSRKFVDLSGIIGQKLASICDEVYEVKLGIVLKIK
ncbi:MAG: bifunctional adenosylcobinamide kinase/adenosylcobinamide-phosphate guanylyltransferase [Campylobacterota bacterium]|nr:bifunctional adenosylcobinamide kinase/adenosylcobinamide-phosphate guanylyltransferase [Campylobacterota bacterium]